MCVPVRFGARKLREKLYIRMNTGGKERFRTLQQDAVGGIFQVVDYNN